MRWSGEAWRRVGEKRWSLSDVQDFSQGQEGEEALGKGTAWPKTGVGGWQDTQPTRGAPIRLAESTRTFWRCGRSGLKSWDNLCTTGWSSQRVWTSFLTSWRPLKTSGSVECNLQNTLKTKKMTVMTTAGNSDQNICKMGNRSVKRPSH